ncbi:MAG: nucleoside diphosphate kinase regulator [Phenylobacterium sp.]|jgi:regulator of nucleoside diphosphate kinase|uniref:nucleoside diphosphate kinase regulator n=1 Tax=Phenylobacterium sp. TaxID=1871053 RepID=UPI002A33AB51|nr:nucleoside diphosphate kinase regulator [Phenylobacterium sp.]MDD3837333.1 nucleoside diphosphate kinase regulator [Phenylobacterium sp.]MDX9997409.1 nucleoside diphosphate kinase regulator [Phenylobacterium sp.]
MLAKTKARRRPAVHLTEADYETLYNLVDAASHEAPGVALLADELERAVVVRNGAAARNYVRLNSRVTYEDVATGQVRDLQISLPKDASIDDNRISVLTPVGAALIGLRPGDTFEWKDAGGRTRTLKVLAVQDA